MTRICGVICEYNPFHKGHAYHLEKARELTQAEVMVCIMSGPFTQRGDPALLSPQLRAKMALSSGADVVVELPAAYAVREAEFFALGGVSILQAMGATHHSFGCEHNNLDGLSHAARILESPTDAFQNTLRAGLMQGHSHARAQGNALAESLNGLEGGMLAAPNNVLAICYLRALLRTGSTMIPVPVKRLGEYHDTGWQEGFASATAAREAIRRGDWGKLNHMIPEAALPILNQALETDAVHTPHALDLLLREKIRCLNQEDMKRFPNVGEGLENRLAKLSPLCTTRKDLLSALKTKRYTHTRLNRLLTHILLDMTKDRLADCRPSAFRLLGFRAEAQGYLSSLPKGLLYTKAARQEKDASFLLDMAAYDLWSLGAELPLGEGYRQQVART